MLTRLRVSGFKNLVDVDVRFGSFTCVAGVNGVGKSNLFDAISFLSLTTELPLVEAAQGVRDEGGRLSDIRSIFNRVGRDHVSEIFFEAEMIIPSKGVDDLGQPAKAGITTLKYSLTISYRQNHADNPFGPIEITKEKLEHLNIGDAPKNLLFPHSYSKWRRSAVHGRRTSEYISTEGSARDRRIRRHQDGASGRPQIFKASNLPRTVLSTVNAVESPTALLVKNEMQSWRLLQLEPSALRRPDEFNSPNKLGADGSHLPATLYHLSRSERNRSQEFSAVYESVATRLSELIDDVKKVEVERDISRELYTLQVTDFQDTVFPAKSLSDGTLRFLALAVIELDPEDQGLICLEEPENGIHPDRITAMLQLLQDIAVDVEEPVGPDNPLRQVIVNTHSPVVVSEVPEESLLVAELREKVRRGETVKSVVFSCLPGTWREKAEGSGRPVTKARLLSYLQPGMIRKHDGKPGGKKRVIDRKDVMQMVMDI